MRKKLLLLPLLLLLSIQLTYSQDRDPRDDQFNFAPGKLIVKLKDHVDAKVQYSAKGVGSTELNIGKYLGINAKVTSAKVLFSESSVTKSVARKKSGKKDPRIPNPSTLKNIFLLELEDVNENILGLVEELNKRDDVEYAEPDYRFSVNDFTIDSEIIYSEESTSIALVPDDPLYDQQTNITQTKIDQVWETYTTGDGSQVIAILDTGVDYTHPDLEANIWINEAELNGVEGYDDDGNGYIDDIRGWDFINLDNEPLDDNMHGTHVAGIAGAVGGNGIGIAGAAWNVKLMPIKVFQSNGVGNASTIAQGVEYATQNGATIQNMSFGSYVESMTLKNALENAYATSVLVASAGNDRICIGPRFPCLPFFPAAYTYVIGVEDAALYSNYDQDGPIFSKSVNLLNYEVKAPGTGIMSTVPNGGYRTLTGTSMSAPLVSGGIALYLNQKLDDSTELLFGNLINTSGTYVDILSAIEVVPTPELKIITAMTLDTINGQNGNEFIEPNEVIEILPLVKNYWGPTDDVRVGIEFAEFEDQTKATILENEISIGSITAYATLQDLTKSLKIKIADGVANNVNIKFVLSVWAGPDKEFFSSTEFVINVKNSILFYGVIDSDQILTPEKEYLVVENLVLSKNAILTILPGTVLKISNDVQISIIDNAKINAIGDKENWITFQAEDIYWAGINFNSNSISEFKYNFVKNVAPQGYFYPNSYSSFFDTDRNFSFENCSFIDNRMTNLFFSGNFDNSIFSNNNVVDNYISIFNIYELSNNFVHIGNNYINNYYFENGFEPHTKHYGFAIGSQQSYEFINIFSNAPGNIGDPIAVWDNKPISFTAKVSGGGSSAPLKSYLGTSNEQRFRESVRDALNFNLADGLVDFSETPIAPYSMAHGIVWKVLVNGKDAQDEYDLIDPIGVGTHTFDVYFNREMDKTIPPQISYGVREPYNQKIISEEGTWSADGKIYTVTHEVKIGAADGINRIRVQDARDLDYFDIPVEDMRFNMLVQSAGSASTGFMATPGLGEITLDWEAPSATELEDVLGYNMYRYEAITDSTFTEVAKINNTLIMDPTFKDFNVEEGTKYFYQYKILRTSFEETDFSKTVTTQPLTSKLGDSNGDFEVNVMDVVQNVDYILGNNPTPFILKAADVNDDTFINVLDIVGTVDIILNPTEGKVASKGAQSINYYDNTPIGDAVFFWEENDLYVESEEPIAGLQLAFEKDFTYTQSQDLQKFESLNYEQDEQQILMLYSFNNSSIPKGKTKLLTRTSTEELEFNVEKAVVATPQGLKLNALFEEKGLGDIEAPIQEDQAKLFVMGPNPTSGLLNVYYYLPEKMDKVQISAYNMQGVRVWSEDRFKNTSGRANATIDLSSLSDGLYFLVVDVIRAGEIQKREVNKIVISKG